MRARATEPPIRTVQRHLGRLRRRVGWVYACRALAAGVGVASLAFAALALAVGPAVSLSWAVAAWTAVGVVTALAVWLALRPVRAVRGTRAANLVQRRDAHLASETRSALELASQQTAAPALVHAHAVQVRDAWRGIRPGDVMPWRRALHPTVWGGLAAAAFTAGVIFSADTATSGAWALLHPGERDERGVRLAAVVSRTSARLSYPAYMQRPSVTVDETAGIDAPRGTTIQYTVHPRIDASAARMRVAGRRVRLTPHEDHAFQGQFVAREGGPIRIRLKSAEGVWLTDSQHRSLHVVPDQAPRVSLSSPEHDRTIELEEGVRVAYDARDDVGLRKVRLVVRLPGDRKVRRTLARFDRGTLQRETNGDSKVVAGELGARPGDRLELWVGAEDGDVVSGPNQGKSEVRTLTVASEATRRLETLGDMEAALDTGLAALADRLEGAIPKSADGARARLDRVRKSTLRFTDSLRELASGLDEGRPGGPRDPSLYREMAQRLRRAATREANAYRGHVPSHARRVQLNTKLVTQLEDSTLALADLLGRARIEDAAELTKKLERLRREMHSLIQELKRTDSPKAKQRLEAALARAQSRMRELMERIGRMGRDVPSGFVNAEALAKRQSSEDALGQMQKALERGNLDEAERQLMDFEHRIGAIADALGKGQKQFNKARFGARQKAMAEAMDSLAGLEAEQRQLAQRSAAIRRRAAQRALKSSEALDGGQRDKLAERARQARKALEKLPRSALGPREQEAYERARQRLVDSRDALRAGDVGEARRMARQAHEELDRLARDLELSALMFPGQEGRMSKAAEAARRATDRSRKLRTELDRALPDVKEFVEPSERARMRKDAERQRKAAKRAKELAEQLAESADGKPLAPDAAKQVGKARKDMDKARKSLQEHSPLEAARRQQEAARRLTELREKMEKGQRNQSPSGGGGNRRRSGGYGGRTMQQRVEIPGTDDHQGPDEMRRRLLDAMREDPPAQYRDSVQRYYEELLK